MDPLTFIKEHDPLSIAFWIALALIIFGCLAVWLLSQLALALWPEEKPDVRVYPDQQRVTTQRQRLKSIAGTDYRERKS